MNEQDTAKPVYVGSGKVIETKTGQTGFKIQIDLGELKAFLRAKENAAHISEWTDRQGVVHKTINLVAWPLREATEHRTHSVKVDTWKPTPREERREEARPEPVAQVQREEQAQDDLPF